MDNKSQKWHHPGGKLRELGVETLSNGGNLTYSAINFY